MRNESYTVQYEICVPHAESKQDAALQAYEFMQEAASSYPPMFTVTNDRTGDSENIDMEVLLDNAEAEQRRRHIERNKTQK